MLGVLFVMFILCLMALVGAGTLYVVARVLEHILLVTLPVIADTYGRLKYPEQYD